MPIISPHLEDPTVDGRQSDQAMRVRRGIIKQFQELNVFFLAEFTLSTGRRADLVGIDPKGEILIIEIKSSVADFNADSKWAEYKDYCDRFYFATHPDVPAEIFPQNEGFILADQYGCEIIREAEAEKLSSARRKALMLRFARSSAQRLTRFSLHEAQ